MKVVPVMILGVATITDLPKDEQNTYSKTNPNKKKLVPSAKHPSHTRISLRKESKRGYFRVSYTTDKDDEDDGGKRLQILRNFLEID
jgi:hypothetical protein